MAANASSSKSPVLTGPSGHSACSESVGESLLALHRQTQANAAQVEEAVAAACSLHEQLIALSDRVARFERSVSPSLPGTASR